MTYKELPREKARKVCKKVKANCDLCPLRREENGKPRFCYYVLAEIYEDVEEELVWLKEETIKYLDEETKKLLESVE